MATKLGNLYNLESYRQFIDKKTIKNRVAQFKFQDALGGNVLSRVLEAVDPRIFEKKYPELAFANSGVTVDNSGGAALTITSLRLQAKGDFTTVGDATSDPGLISLSGEENQIRVITRRGKSIWTDDELARNELQGINLVQKYLATHNEIYLRNIDQIGLVGVAGISEGLLNSSAFVSSVAAFPIGALSPLQMYQEFQDLIDAQANSVSNTPEYAANRVIMPTNVFNTIRSTTLSTTADNPSSVLVALKLNYPQIEFLSTFRTPAGGQSSTVAYSTSDEAMVMRIPEALKMGEIIQPDSFDFSFSSKYRIAGLDVLDTTSGQILRGL